MKILERWFGAAKERVEPQQEERIEQQGTIARSASGREKEEEGLRQRQQLSPSTLDNIVIACGITLGCGFVWLISLLWGGF